MSLDNDATEPTLEPHIDLAPPTQTAKQGPEVCARCGHERLAHQGFCRAFGCKGPCDGYTPVKGQAPAEPPRGRPPVTLPLVVHVTGAREDTWPRLKRALTEQGWYPQGNVTNAWHLTRGGARTVRVDLTHPRDAASRDMITVQLVRARYVHVERRPADNSALEFVQIKDTVGGEFPRPYRDHQLDIDAVIDLIHHVTTATAPDA